MTDEDTLLSGDLDKVPPELAYLSRYFRTTGLLVFRYYFAFSRLRQTSLRRFIDFFTDHSGVLISESYAYKALKKIKDMIEADRVARENMDFAALDKLHTDVSWAGPPK